MSTFLDRVVEGGLPEDGTCVLVLVSLGTWASVLQLLKQYDYSEPASFVFHLELQQNYCHDQPRCLTMTEQNPIIMCA